MTDSPRRTRLAPSPTGPLHVGNACSFLVTWALARTLGWELLLRVEDLDDARAREESVRDIGESFAWLGIDHDGPAVHQRDRLDRYRAAMRALAAAGLVYESPHSRSEVREAAAALHAPHAPEANAFPATLRPPPGAAWGFAREEINHRLRVEPGAEPVEDQVAGARSFDCARETGDCIVWTKAGYPAYQLAVVVDDLAQGVSDVVRGDDLLPSAALQQRIWRALGAAPPRWWHLPLVLDAQSQRMAKRRGSESLRALREAGVDPARVVGLVAWWCGAQEVLAPMDPGRLRGRVDPSILRRWHERARTAPPRLDEATLAWLHRT